MFQKSLNYSSETCKMTIRKIGKQLELGSRSTITYRDPNFLSKIVNWDNLRALNCELQERDL
jgi:hypothetical protein